MANVATMTAPTKGKSMVRSFHNRCVQHTPPVMTQTGPHDPRRGALVPSPARPGAAYDSGRPVPGPPIVRGDTTMTTDIEAVLGTDAALLDHKCAGVPQDLLHLPGPDFIDRVWPRATASPAVLGNLQRLHDTGRLGGHRLPVDPAGRPGDRALGGRLVRAEPRLLRPGEHRASWRSRAAATRSPRRSACSARCRAGTRTGSRSSSRSTTTSCSPTRTSSRPDPVRAGRAGVGDGRGGGGRHDLLRLRGRRTREIVGGRRGLRRTRTSWAWRPSSGATCATTPSRRTASTTTPPPT